MTKFEFLDKAREKHGYKYQYPLLGSNIRTKDKIDVLYNDVLYTQTVSKHLMGRCPEKATPRKTTEQFIKESKEVWGDKYDYSLTKYKSALDKVKIIYDGVVFEQRASSHLIQAPEYKMNYEYFMKLSKDKWGDKYDYSKVDFVNTKKDVIIIYNGVEYSQSPSNHLRYAPENKTQQLDTQEFIDRSNEIHSNKYDYSKTEYTLSREKVIIICPEHGEFEQIANSHLRGMGCKKCGDKNKDRVYEVKYTTEQFIQESKSIWGNKYDYSLTEYINMRTKVKIIHDGIVYHQTPGSHFKYPVEGFMDKEIFLIKAKRKWGDKYDYSLVDYKNSKYKIKIKYGDDVYEQYPYNHLLYAPELRNRRTTQDFIRDSINIHGDLYDYTESVYKNSKHKVKILCRTHGYFYQLPQVHLRGSGCPKCKESYGEKRISEFLKSYNIDYKKEYSFQECRNVYPLRFDFYIPSMRTCIEFDGIQHYQPVEFFGGTYSYYLLKENDNIKDDYCEDNYINLIRIKYDEIDNIPSILYSHLAYHIRRLGLN